MKSFDEINDAFLKSEAMLTDNSNPDQDTIQVIHDILGWVLGLYTDNRLDDM
jgi:hypothetical protein